MVSAQFKCYFFLKEVISHTLSVTFHSVMTTSNQNLMMPQTSVEKGQLVLKKLCFMVKAQICKFYKAFLLETWVRLFNFGVHSTWKRLKYFSQGTRSIRNPTVNQRIQGQGSSRHFTDLVPLSQNFDLKNYKLSVPR